MKPSLVLVCAMACGGRKPAPPLPPLAHEAYAHYLDGKLASYRDDWPGAADALAAAAAAAPDQPMIAVELARAQARAKRVEAARATLVTARQKWPKHAQVWIASGDLLAASAPAEAIRAYRRAIELEPGEERAYLGLAKLEQPESARRTLRRLVERVPASIEGHYRLGQRYAQTRDVPAAIAQMQKVLELDPDHIDARLDLSRGLRLEGKLDEAIAQARSAFDRSGQALDLAEELYYLLLEADDRTAAIDLLTLLDDDRSDTDALAMVARFDRALGRLDEARTVAARIAKLDADLGALVVAEIDLAAGDPAAAAKRALGLASPGAAGARSDAERRGGAIETSSEKLADARRIAAAALLANAEPQRALDALAPVRAGKPRDVELATLAAFALADLGKLAEARAVLAKLGDDAAATYARARLADHAGDPATALALLEPLIAANPDLAVALNLAGYLLADAGTRLADAERYLRRARELSPGDAAILDSWGVLLLRKGQHREAVRTLDRAARFAPREPEIQLHLAQAWIADGAPKTGAATLDRAASLHPPRAVLERIEAARRGLPARDR